MASMLVAAVMDMWADVDRAFADLSEADALKRHEGGSAFAWTLQHIAGFEDGQFNVRLRGQQRNPVLMDQFERFRETPGTADRWDAIQQAVRDLREEFRAYFEPLSEAELAALMAPATARTGEQAVRMLLMRDIAHTYYHIGEVAAKRDQLGQRTGDYPSTWEHAV